MSQFKNNPKLKLFYTDTDSIYTNLNPDEMNKLIPKSIDNKLIGKFKLETISSQRQKAIFLGPKVYYLKTIDEEEIIKVKGLSSKATKTLTVNDFEALQPTADRDKLIEKSQQKCCRRL